MENFKRAAFRLFSSTTPVHQARAEQIPEQVIHVMRSMMALTNKVLGPYDASAVLTRTEEDANWGTQVYVRIACTDESQEQALLRDLGRSYQATGLSLTPGNR